MGMKLSSGITRRVSAAVLLLLAATSASADDIDIYAGGSNNTAAEPVVMFLMDNSPNWSKNDQKVTDTTGAVAASGVVEAQAIQVVLAPQNGQGPAIKAGVAMLTNSSLKATGGGSIQSGGYIRFGARDMQTSANYTALNTLLGWYSSGNNITNSAEKLASQSDKNESAAFYELYKYYQGLAPFAGTQSSASKSQPSNQFVDISGNTDNNTIGGYTASGLGLTSGFAIQGGNYQNPLAGNSCAKGYIIYIANNANYNFQTGSQQFESGGASAGAALPAHVDDSWADEWAKYNLQNGIVTYVIDVFKQNQDVSYSTSLNAIATAGGGQYYQVGNEADLILVLKKILAQIQSVNSTFASASLPVNTTNRTQDLNQVFIGSFRPESTSAPRWKGNLKEYQIISTLGILNLGDSLGNNALSPTTGYIADCAVSYWTTDTSSVSPPSTAEAYWLSVPDSTAQNGQQPVTKSQCVTAPTPSSPGLPAGMTAPSLYSDWPDGPAVEKGGAAEVIRKGNNPPTTQTSPTFKVNRSVMTLSGSTLSAVTTTNTGLSATVLSWVTGSDNDASVLSPGPEKPGNATASPYNTRPSLHGDVIHSRPQPINYGGSNGTAIFYGSNDGMYRAINATTGAEMWSFIAPEFFNAANSLNNYSKFQRLYDNSPQVYTPGLPSGITPTPTVKDYFFDGNTGVYQSDDNSQVYIFPSMRRGGRMVYALNVTNPASPTYMWKFGCPDAADDSGCTTGSTAIGQTWSTPTTAFVRGYSTTQPILIMGGGYDVCEDANTPNVSCSSPKGALIYILDATTGNILKTFTTTRSVAADPALATVHSDGYVDYAYFADTGGNIYRLDFSNTSGVSQNANGWTFHRIAYTTGGGRKFLFAPTILPTTTSAGTPQAAFVALGSGDREHPLISEYPYTTPITNRFYVLLDDLTTQTRAVVNLDDTTTSDTFYMGDYSNNNCSTSAACAALQVVPNSSATTPLQVGWFINLAAGRGEQTVTSSLVIGGDVAFSTNRPIPASQSSCTSTLGEARGYNLSLFSGGGALNGGNRSGTFLQGGLPASPTLFTTTVNGQLVTGTIGVKTDTCSSAQCPGKPQVTISPKRRIVYWHLSGDNK